MTSLGLVAVLWYAVVLGAATQWAVELDGAFRWPATSVGALIGTLSGGVWLVPAAGPHLEGVAVWPALIGGFVLGVVFDRVAQRVVRGRRLGARARASSLMTAPLAR